MSGSIFIERSDSVKKGSFSIDNSTITPITSNSQSGWGQACVVIDNTAGGSWGSWTGWWGSWWLAIYKIFHHRYWLHGAWYWLLCWPIPVEPRKLRSNPYQFLKSWDREWLLRMHQRSKDICWWHAHIRIHIHNRIVFHASIVWF